MKSSEEGPWGIPSDSCIPVLGVALGIPCIHQDSFAPSVSRPGNEPLGSESVIETWLSRSGIWELLCCGELVAGKWFAPVIRVGSLLEYFTSCSNKLQRCQYCRYVGIRRRTCEMANEVLGTKHSEVCVCVHTRVCVFSLFFWLNTGSEYHETSESCNFASEATLVWNSDGYLSALFTNESPDLFPCGRG